MKIAIGTRVEVLWHERWGATCAIISYHRNGIYKVKFDDGDTEKYNEYWLEPITEEA